MSAAIRDAAALIAQAGGFGERFSAPAPDGVRRTGAVVLDASALIALLKGEPGAAKVAEVIALAQMSVVNYAEVVSHFIHAGMPEREIDAMLDPLPIILVPVDKPLAQLAGRLRSLTAPAGLSLGDRFCLALARSYGLPAWTGDPRWKAIAEDAGVKLVVIR